MALDYVIQHAPYVSAEIYSIFRGDHAFLVIARVPNTVTKHNLKHGEMLLISAISGRTKLILHQHI